MRDGQPDGSTNLHAIGHPSGGPHTIVGAGVGLKLNSHAVDQVPDRQHAPYRVILQILLVVGGEVSPIPILRMPWVLLRTAIVAIPFVFGQPHFLVGAVSIMHFLDLFEDLVDLSFHFSRVRIIPPLHPGLLAWQHRPVHRGANNLLRLLEVVFQVDRSERLILPNRVESTTRVIGQPLDHKANPQQLLHGGLILPMIDASKSDLAPTVPQHPLRLQQGLGQIADHKGELLIRRLLLVPGRHLACIELIENILPVQSIGAVGNGARQIFEIEVRFCRDRIVAVVAVVLEKALNGIRRTHRLRSGFRARQARSDQHQGGRPDRNAHGAGNRRKK